MSDWGSFATLTAVVAALWAYGSGGEEKRSNFRSWAAGRMSAFAPAARRLTWGIIFGALTVAAGAIVISSGFAILEFLSRTGPISRGEIFNLVLNCFNAVMYLAGGAGCMALLFEFPERKSDEGSHVLSSGKDECIELLLQDVGDTEALLQQLRSTGITIHLNRAAPGNARFSVRAPEPFRQAVKSLST
ncbi:hypothetical protein [Pseudomonas multiresinivorans]|uniref:Uncharacterized protein n=1 Tax=Pseudomonas multiresinivorans TaxID=95301 RepID=A0A7Z3BN73_9PSED|nr:hypothetical protein [Pseudomonas multiresinivorans]QJP10014.1 hypothetical protein G4G71_19740 [Pseudomonas multiresinivorans]